MREKESRREGGKEERRELDREEERGTGNPGRRPGFWLVNNP